MKKFILILFLARFSLFDWGLQHHRQKTEYRVYKIDSVKSFYLIYAQKDSLRYKIVSKKAKADASYEKIRINGYYAFRLHSMSVINGKPITTAMSTYETSGMYVDDSTIVNFEKETQWDLYYAENIKGLCIIPNN